MDHTQHTGGSYVGKEAEYALANEKKPFNVYYSRPGLLALIPQDVGGKSVLDAGCGPGWYTEYLLGQGADVTGFDLHQSFVAMTKERVHGKARVVQADLGQPLTFAADRSFDIIIASLILHYLEDWLPPLKELCRVLKPGGQLIFSTHHPFNDWRLFDKEDYFATEIIHDEWEIGPVSFYRRPLTKICADLKAAGFFIDTILEPQPRPEFEAVDPEVYARLQKNPWFIVFRAQKR